MSTKAEVEKENKTLRAEIRELRKASKESSASLEGMPFTGIGVGLDSDGKFNLVHIKFDLESKSAAVAETLRVMDYAPETAGYAKTALVDEIIRLSKERK